MVHTVSDALVDRHPYDFRKKENYENFSKKVHKNEVCVAFGERSVPKLAALLESDDISEDIKLEAVSHILDLASDQSTKCEIINHPGIMASCSSLLTSELAPLRTKAALVVASLCLLIPGRQECEKVNNIVALTKMLRDVDIKAKEAATSAFMNLALFTDGCKLITDNVESMTELVELFNVMLDEPRKRSQKIAFQIASCFAGVTRQSEGKDQAFDNKCIQPLLTATSKQYPGLRQAAITSLWNLSLSLDRKIEVIETLDSVVIIADMLHDSDKTVRRQAAGALSALATNEQGKIAIFNDTVVMNLTNALNDEDSLVKSNAAHAIQLASENSNVLEKFVQILISSEDNLKYAFQVNQRATAVLNDLLLHEDENIQTSACNILCDSTYNDQGKESLLNCLNSIERLCSILSESKESVVVDNVLNALLNLATENQSVLRRIKKQTETNATLKEVIESFDDLYQALNTKK